VSRAALVAPLALVLALAGGAAAQGEDVPALIRLVEHQPAGMDRVTWKERRRDAAKKLGASGDRRAVPVLVALADRETFDIIGEIAIDGLGQLGDRSAVPVLQTIAGDPSRDVTQRDKARRALARLGARDAPATAPATGADEPAPDPGLPPVDRFGAASPGGPTGPTWASDVLAATERLTFVAGTAGLAYDTTRKRLTLDLDAAGSFERSLDRERSAWRWGVDANLVGGAFNPEGPAKTTLVLGAVGGHGEFRAYGGSELYGVGFGRARLEGSRLSRTIDDGTETNADRWLALDAQIALGGGWGRVFEVGSRQRVARLAELLTRRRALGRPIDEGVARRLQSTWWALRGRLGGHRLLTATVAILRDAGVLLGEPDAGLAYELLQVLEDPAFDRRASGFDVQLAFGEGFLSRSRAPDDLPGLDEGRLEQLLARARYVQQLDLTSDVDVAGWARYRLFPPDGAPAPWALGGTARWRRFVYGEHLDPRGALDVGGQLALSSSGVEGVDRGLRIGAEVGWTVLWSRASSLRLAGGATFDSGEWFLGVRLHAAYGLLDAAFAAER
jgi:hypothetical protein